MSSKSDLLFTRWSGDEASLTARLVGCLPAATIELETLCRLAGIKVNREIPTAAVECVRRPRLLINPDFAAKYCVRDEHLFLLVMHELWHIILAHTRLYPRVTPAHNIAFDAIINAGLSRQYNKPEFRGFLEELNPADAFPSMLLRPPIGWPHHPEYPEGGPPGTRQILERLYPPAAARQVSMPFYDEILNLLRKYAEQNGWVWVEGEPFLLGDHNDPDSEGQIFVDPVLGETMRRIASKMPAQLVGNNRSSGGLQVQWQTDVGPSAEQTRRAFSGVLRRCLGPRRGKRQRKKKSPVSGIAGTSVLPNARDRLAPARRLIGMPGTIWSQQGTVKARVPETPSKAHIYLDVSGSMAEVLPYLLGLVLPYIASGQADVFQFSTIVQPLPLARLQRGRLQTTGGTDINCVLEHLLNNASLVQRALLLTDGATGVPTDDYAARLREQNVRIYVVMPAENAWEEDLRDFASFMTILPPLWGTSHNRNL
jgi:hypothetical protein